MQLSGACSWRLVCGSSHVVSSGFLGMSSLFPGGIISSGTPHSGNNELLYVRRPVSLYVMWVASYVMYKINMYVLVSL